MTGAPKRARLPLGQWGEGNSDTAVAVTVGILQLETATFLVGSSQKTARMTNLSSTKTLQATNRRAMTFAIVWMVSVLTLSRFCFLEMKALKLEMALWDDTLLVEEDSWESSIPQDSDTATDTALLGIHSLQDDNDSRRDNDDNDYYGDIGNDDSSTPKEPASLPRLILHVGPSKSATTTLQTDLTAALDEGWLTSEYLGRFYRPYRAPSTNALMLNRSESPLLIAAREMLHSSQCRHPSRVCCSKFHNLLEAYRKWNRTVILSDEAFGNMWTDPAQFRAIQESLASEWRVTVVVGYRHFYEWILSSKYQRDRTDRIANLGKVQWPANGGGRSLLPMFPDTLNDWRQWFHYTDSIVHAAKASMEVRIFDLHAMTNASILTQFLCTADLADDCVTSEQRDSDKSSVTIMNAQANTTIPSLYYDAIATMAAELRLVNTSLHQRSSIREAVRAFHEDKNGLGPNDLILQCPHQTELQKLLDYSLEMENLFFVVPDPQAHVDGFWAKANSKAFCWVNASAVVQSKPWLDFFAQL